MFKVHELRHYRPGQAHSGVVQLDLVQKLATLGPGSLNYLNRIKDMLLRGYGISKVLPFTKHLPPEPYTIDIHSLYSHPFSALAEPTDFSSFYYCCFNFAETQGTQSADEYGRCYTRCQTLIGHISNMADGVTLLTQATQQTLKGRTNGGFVHVC